MYPNQIPVGAFKCTKGRELNEEYSEFIENGKGTILISFGSMVKTLPDNLINTFIQIFNLFPEYRFIWR